MKTLSHVWQMIRHDKLFSGIYIFGTALAIATGTVMAILNWMQIAPVYPEYQRDNTYYLQSIQLDKTGGQGRYIFSFSYPVVRDFFYNLENATLVSAEYSAWGDNWARNELSGMAERMKARYIDPAFFELYSFEFLAGAPFSKEEFDSGVKVAVITERLGRQIFGAEEVASLLGRKINIDGSDYRICGVVREGSPSEHLSYANFFTPYTNRSDYKDEEDAPLLGNYEIKVISDNPEALTEEVRAYFDRFNSSQSDYKADIFSQPLPHYWVQFSNAQFRDFGVAQYIASMFGLLMVLMLVPALNLSGIISGRMEGRLPEMGVRKSFGATRGRLLGQVLWENLILTLVGGLIGLFFAWIMVKCGIASLFDKNIGSGGAPVSNEVILSPVIFACMFLLCCVLNIVSALVPAWRSLRRPIVESLKEK